MSNTPLGYIKNSVVEVLQNRRLGGMYRIEVEGGDGYTAIYSASRATISTDIEERLDRIANYQHSSRGMLIHDCALGTITMGDISDLLAMLATERKLSDSLYDEFAQHSEWSESGMAYRKSRVNGNG